MKIKHKINDIEVGKEVHDYIKKAKKDKEIINEKEEEIRQKIIKRLRNRIKERSTEQEITMPYQSYSSSYLFITLKFIMIVHFFGSGKTPV